MTSPDLARGYLAKAQLRLEVLGGRLPAELRERLPRAAEISKSLRRERELAFYGDIDFIPTEEYTEAHGRAAYDGAAFVLALVQAVMRQLPGPR